MSKQPEALQIADGIEQSTTCIWHPAATAQIRRLHAANVELLEVIKELTHSLDREELLHDDQRSGFDKARAAIAKHRATS